MMITFPNDIADYLDANKNRVYVIDSNIFELYKNLFSKINKNSQVYILEANERTKNLDSVKEIYQFFLKNNVNRNQMIVGIGGGITTDITAFAASTFKRGCRLSLIPTTLLGMIDAAIGGKTGVNINNVKNGIGSFYNAEEVIIDTKFLSTLPDKDFKDGFVEIIKMSFLPNSNLYQLLSNKTKLDKIIKMAIEIKRKICEKDLYDKGLRNQLNLGHTFGHVLESISNYEISHGTAVAVGIRAAAKFSWQNGFINKVILTEIEERLNKFDLPSSFDHQYLSKISSHGEAILKQDKKADDQLKFVLFKNIQELFISKIEFTDDILNVLKDFADDKT